MSGSESGAWSTLRTLLAEKNLTVVDLHERLREQGFDVNNKSLYRFTTSRPVQKIDTAIVRAICEALDVGLEFGVLPKLLIGINERVFKPHLPVFSFLENVVGCT